MNLNEDQHEWILAGLEMLLDDLRAREKMSNQEIRLIQEFVDALQQPTLRGCNINSKRLDPPSSEEREEIRRYRAALNFYAKKEVYERPFCQPGRTPGPRAIDFDQGKKARDALATPTHREAG